MIFVIHKVETTQAGPEMNIFGFKCNCVKMGAIRNHRVDRVMPCAQGTELVTEQTVGLL